MIKFKKAFNFNILALIIIILFLSAGGNVCAEEFTLRLPVGGTDDTLIQIKKILEDKELEEYEKDIFFLGMSVGKAILEKNKAGGRQANILFIGDNGSLKTTFAESVEKILAAKKKLKVQIVDTDSAEYVSKECTFGYFDEKYKTKNVIIADAAVRYPGDRYNIDLLVRFKSSLGVRQSRIEKKSGSHEYAKIRTMLDSSPDDEMTRPPDYIINTDNISIEYTESAEFKRLLEAGLMTGFATTPAKQLEILKKITSLL